MTEVLWVPVPGGLSGSDAVVQVLVVPRLQGGPLSDFGMQDWPALLESATFEVRTRTSQGIQVADADVTYTHAASSEVWQQFFGGAAGVANEFVQKTYPPPAVADTYGQASAVVGTYQDSATALADPDVDADAVVRDKLGTWFDPTPLAPPLPQPPVPPPPTTDFHATVALLREHPAVLRRLGLVFEVTVDRVAFDVGAPDSRFLSIRCPDPPLSFLVTGPWTHYQLTADKFVPAPSTSAAADIRGGLLDLGQATTIAAPSDGDDEPAPRWAVTTFEVDGVVGRLRDAAKAERTGGDGPAVLPGIRTGGMSLVRPDRAGDLSTRVGRANTNRLAATVEDAEFHAEDLVLGYRVDVRSGDDPTWRSLCARQARYDVNGLPIEHPAEGITALGDGFAEEDGHVKANAAVRDPDGTLRADQIVARWDGWSLAVPRPNLLDNTPGSVRKTNVPLPYEFGFEYRLAPGSLPPLRFSRRYSMRVRIADLAGGGLPVDHQSASTASTDTILYLRHEPVLPPVTAATGSFAVGASIDRLIIRSDFDRTVEQVSAERPAYPVTDRRTLLAPQTTFAVAEQHGEFDPGRDQARTREWAERALTVFARQGESAERGLPDPAANGVNAVLQAEAGGLAAPLSERSAWRPDWPDPAPKAVRLVEGSGITMHWDGDTLVVALARGEQVTVALSSTIRDGYTDHFAMFEWLSQAGLSDGSLVGAQNGAHPLLSPPRLLRLVHAVRRPLAKPKWLLSEDRIDRAPGDTTALLSPRFDAAGLNTDSTAAIDVAATWTDRDDGGTEQVTVEHLHTEPIARGEPAFTPLRHAFGDTRHRMVTYTLTAVSRFRDCYAADEPDAAFRVGLAQLPVSVPSSARPPAPEVLAVRPAFRQLPTSSTSDRIEHARTGCLRVELARPWFQTGEGECLAVLVAPAGEDGTELTRVGRDPIVGSPALPAFPADTWFGRGRKHFVPELGAQVLAVPFQVVDAGDRWQADVSVTLPVPSYLPFVRLVVARYQPSSINGFELSTVVTTDMVPLPPERRLTVTRAGQVARVELTGPMPEPRSTLEVTVEEFVSPNGSTPQEADLIDLTGALGAIPAWRPVQGLVTVTGATTASVDLAALSGSAPVRLRVRESDLRPAVTDAVTPELAERSPFVDLVDLPPAWLI